MWAQELDATGRKSSQVCYQFMGGGCTQLDCNFSHDRDAVKRAMPTARTAASVEVCFDYSRSDAADLWTASMCTLEVPPLAPFCARLLVESSRLAEH